MNLASCFISNLHLLSKEMSLEGVNGMKLTQGQFVIDNLHSTGHQ